MKKKNRDQRNFDKALRTFDLEMADKEINPGLKKFDDQSVKNAKKLLKNNPFYK